MKYVKPERISISGHPELTERWVQERIAEDPSILGLGDLILKDKERLQPLAGRLDLLCQDAESNRRYEIEIQLGKTDESNIIRTIEYWDIERKRYPQYEHTAVIVAEDITSRFLNVISLFNGFVPLVAIQMQAVKIGDQVALIFTKVLDQVRLGMVEEDEAVQETTDRAYWEKRASKATLEMTDELIAILRDFNPKLSPKYNKFYVGLADGSGQPSNFVIFRPKKDWVRIEPRLPKSGDVQTQLEEQGSTSWTTTSGGVGIEFACQRANRRSTRPSSKHSFVGPTMRRRSRATRIPTGGEALRGRRGVTTARIESRTKEGNLEVKRSAQPRLSICQEVAIELLAHGRTTQEMADELAGRGTEARSWPSRVIEEGHDHSMPGAASPYPFSKAQG